MNNKNKSILIVEDESALRSVLRDKLMSEGFDVLEAKNGKEGLVLALREHPQAILLDIIMPVMDGMTMLTKLRQDKWGESAKVIILTNLADTEKVAEAIEHGSFEYLVKSNWKLGEVVEKVKESVKK